MLSILLTICKGLLLVAAILFLITIIFTLIYAPIKARKEEKTRQTFINVLEEMIEEELKKIIEEENKKTTSKKKTTKKTTKSTEK